MSVNRGGSRSFSTVCLKFACLPISSLRYRRQILALKHYFARTGATVMVLDDLTAETLLTSSMHSIAHGVIQLEELAPDYGGERRSAARGQISWSACIRGGYHDFVIRPGGVQVFPRLVSSEHSSQIYAGRYWPSTIGRASMLCSAEGVERGSSVLILGPAGTGKSLTALTFIAGAVRAAAKHAAMFVFDEELGLLIGRDDRAEVSICRRVIDDGKLTLEQVDAAELSPGELVGACPPTAVSERKVCALS